MLCTNSDDGTQRSTNNVKDNHANLYWMHIGLKIGMASGLTLSQAITTIIWNTLRSTCIDLPGLLETTLQPAAIEI